jgi:hypothetical protein
VSDYFPEAEFDDEDEPLTYVISDLPADSSVKLTRDFGATRNLLALAIWVPYAMIAILLVFGGLAGKFGPEIVDPVVAAYAASATAVAYFYFRHRSPYAKPVPHNRECCCHHTHRIN